MTTQAQQIEIFEPAMMEVEYNKKMVRDTLNRENDFISEAVRLRIGKKTSMFYSPKELWYDSLSCNQELKTQVFLQYSRSKGKLSAPAGFYKERVYKNHPVGKITVFPNLFSKKVLASFNKKPFKSASPQSNGFKS